MAKKEKSILRSSNLSMSKVQVELATVDKIHPHLMLCLVVSPSKPLSPIRYCTSGLQSTEQRKETAVVLVELMMSWRQQQLLESSEVVEQNRMQRSTCSNRQSERVSSLTKQELLFRTVAEALTPKKVLESMWNPVSRGRAETEADENVRLEYICSRYRSPVPEEMLAAYIGGRVHCQSGGVGTGNWSLELRYS